MNRRTTTTITVLATLLCGLGCVELDTEEDGSSGRPGFGETALTLEVIASAPRPGDDEVPFEDLLIILRVNWPVLEPGPAITLAAGDGPVPVSTAVLTLRDPYLVRVKPAEPLAPDTDYALRVRGGPDGLLSYNGATLPDDVVIEFHTAAE